MTALILTLYRWLLGERDWRVSHDWLRDQQRMVSRVDFHGPRWPWPVRPRSTRQAEVVPFRRKVS